MAKLKLKSVKTAVKICNRKKIRKKYVFLVFTLFSFLSLKTNFWKKFVYKDNFEFLAKDIFFEKVGL